MRRPVPLVALPAFAAPPAAHGCIRVPMSAAPTMYDELSYDTVVDVY